ncbi:dihydrodipicolinate synthase family protein [Streptomyces mobaraensis]|uniref:Dihydrodipicolinate synthase family protein n=1 Tax=Streptomyces mobaraensis TaxID=35621 RepID=A0A5N5W941_STRMB|nr:dihydrodipicolinate synthase family protein [Streptomyces mobaraensis]KAB7846605.1 dihydrodipicolinate synthase family protein [Streptomyces mobaraensis]
MRPTVRPTGFIPPLCTPLTPDGAVDTRSLHRLVEHVLDGGASALFALGTCGEAVFLTDEQRRTVVRTAVEAAGGRVPVLAGVIDTTTPRVLERAREAAGLGADVLVATAPFYTDTHPAETADHFRRVRAETGLPLLAYDIPSRVHTKLPPAVLLELAEDRTLVGLKDSSGDLDTLRHLLVALRRRGLDRRFSVLTGSELTADAALLIGADGVVAGLGNVDPAAYTRLHTHATAGRWPEAVTEQNRLTTLQTLTRAADPATMSGTAAAVGAYKAALELLGVIDCRATATPLRPLPQESVEEVRRRLEEGGLLPG